MSSFEFETLEPEHETPQPLFGKLLPGVVWLVFLVFSAVRTTFPAVNEPHYWTKAKHFWDPSWCANDFFLNSSNPHYVYYLTFGLLPQIFSLEVSAVLGRLITLGILAMGWTAFLSAIFRSRVSILLVTGLFLLSQSIGNWSGEWVVGGAESKVVAYGLIFWSLGFARRKQWWATAITAGLAVSFHPVVGVWSCLAGCGAIAMTHSAWGFSNGVSNGLSQGSKTAKTAPIIFILCTLPGLIPAIWLVLSGTQSKQTAIADSIQVFSRLKHHLDPTNFQMTGWIQYGILLLIWIVVAWGLSFFSHSKSKLTPPSEVRFQFVRLYILGALIFAICGTIIGYHSGAPEEMFLFDLRVKLMKFYPFRLFDLMLPVAVAISAVRLGEHLTDRYLRFEVSSERVPRKEVIAFCVGGILFASVIASFLMPERQPSWQRQKAENRKLWRETCSWIRNKTPQDAVLIPPRSNFALIWYSHRAVYVTRKDCPQETLGIIEWNQRLLSLKKWRDDSLTGNGLNKKDKTFDVVDLQKLQQFSQADFLIIDNPRRAVAAEPVYKNARYRVFNLNINSKTISPETIDSETKR